MISLLLVKKICELFIIMLAGFLVVKLKAVKAEESVTLSSICIYIVYPAMMIDCFMIDLTPEIQQGMLLSACAAVIISLLAMAVGWVYGRITHSSPVEIAAIQFSNAGNLIIPIVLSVLGSEWVVYTSTYIAVQNVLVWTVGVKAFNSGAKVSFKKMLLNINMVAMYIGFLLFAAGIRLPLLLEEALSSAASLAGPVSMIVMGMLIASADLKAIFTNMRIYLVALMRMLVCPAIALCAIKLSGAEALMPSGGKILLVTFLAAAAPTASMITQLSLMYKQDSAYASAITIFTTLICIVTMPAFVFLYELL